MKKLLLLLILFLSLQIAHAHVGSSGVQMQGQAGPYQIMVSIQPPDVIPGTAQITVFVESGNVKHISARPIFYRSGDKGAPSPDLLQKVEGVAGEFQGMVWLMEPGSSGVQLMIEGQQGKAQLVVPLAAASTAQRDMPNGLSMGLAALALLLFVLMITAIGASVSDGLLRPGEALSAARKRKRWVNMGIASAICMLILYAGSSWWDSWAAHYRRYLYKPLTAHSAILRTGDQRRFQLKIDTTDWADNKRGTMLSTIIPDHGKLMHTFLVRIPGLDAFAHLHPERKDSTTFEAWLPELPAGRYLVYSDFVRYSGFGETMTDTLDIPPGHHAPHSQITAEEDTYVITDPMNAPGKAPATENFVICGKPGSKTVFKDGSYAVWEGKSDQPLEAGKPYQLNFEMYNPDGSACLPEPYLGMLGHVALFRSDGSVYIHLHPGGTFASAAGQSFRKRLADTSQIAPKPSPAIFRDSVDQYLTKLKSMNVLQREQLLMTEMGMYETTANGAMGMEHGNRISFPYAFPKSGKYRIFLQVKRNGKVLTGAFDVSVKDNLNL
ncbi:hypothetical protein DYBT9275_00680 [Dyadobacter sp. CECT 9275]|uniref:Uncharacterized protein n=1 Tax=Dyadobacter helix TaxID=2822344 RepID=A0A916N4E1_9BACT|nr:hypothetical protein [Dyadobacter sp. CECT 9275]CAG4991103.1 hypothetical protein DYBT9275_00680 [Dyadobacter sp. CECT 9275]